MGHGPSLTSLDQEFPVLEGTSGMCALTHDHQSLGRILKCNNR